MLRYLRLEKRNRRLATLAALVFALWTVAAMLPHAHGLPVASFGTSGPAITATRTAPACVLCDWLATPQLPLALVTMAFLPRLLAFVPQPERQTARGSLPAPRRCPRAPPV